MTLSKSEQFRDASSHTYRHTDTLNHVYLKSETFSFKQICNKSLGRHRAIADDGVRGGGGDNVMVFGVFSLIFFCLNYYTHTHTEWQAAPLCVGPCWLVKRCVDFVVECAHHNLAKTLDFRRDCCVI